MDVEHARPSPCRWRAQADARSRKSAIGWQKYQKTLHSIAEDASNTVEAPDGPIHDHGGRVAQTSDQQEVATHKSHREALRAQQVKTRTTQRQPQRPRRGCPVCVQVGMVGAGLVKVVEVVEVRVSKAFEQTTDENGDNTRRPKNPKEPPDAGTEGRECEQVNAAGNVLDVRA